MPQIKLNMKINETIRKDGLHIISCYIPHRKTIHVELVARVGYAYDLPGKQGLFHCFEHMAFKGTSKRSSKELSSFSSRNFLNANAATGALGTTYSAVVIDRKLPLACEYLCDIYLNSTFPQKELVKEKGPILLEIARRKDNDFFTARQVLSEHLYKDNPIRNFGDGTLDGIRKIEKFDLIREKYKWHIPSNTVAIALGNVKHNDFIRQINKNFPFKSHNVSHKEWADESEQLPLKNRIVITRPDREKTIILAGCKIPKNIDERTMETFSMLGKIVGQGPGSMLWDEIREKHGLAYIVDSSYTGIEGLGYFFFIYIETEPAMQKRVEEILWQTLLRPLCSKQKFEELKEIMFDAFEITSVEQSIDYESLIWRKIVERKPVKSVEKEDKKRLKIISSLFLKDLEKVRQEYIRSERFVTVIVKPGKMAKQ